ncbi:hypothetical protein PSTG_04003 [Puccinia striiformis f. sp. tritici PST-78]|uniref:Uncharacterized protein n=1 Tax=Puccinia striiformis f. sp. tritici PST-78 TaxID=1165861 RepID=A0A0L0VU28_9BASI|nr:hypothetical protein PSTG_04003 [Puccinia striiformis f. sp. tritici PST-78]
MVASSIMINDDSETKLGGPDNHALGIAVVFESMCKKPQSITVKSFPPEHQHSRDRNAKVRNAKDRDPEDVDSREANWMWVYNSMRIALDGFNKPILVYPGSFRSVESPTLTITPDSSLIWPKFPTDQHPLT